MVVASRRALDERGTHWWRSRCCSSRCRARRPPGADADAALRADRHARLRDRDGREPRRDPARRRIHHGHARRARGLARARRAAGARDAAPRVLRAAKGASRATGRGGDCARRGAETFYGTGEENQAIAFPAGYGYRVRRADRWRLGWMFMNHRPSLRAGLPAVHGDRHGQRADVTPVTPYWISVSCVARQALQRARRRRPGRAPHALAHVGGAAQRADRHRRGARPRRRAAA